MAQRFVSTALNCKQKISKKHFSGPSVYSAVIKKIETPMTSLRGKHKYGVLFSFPHALPTNLQKYLLNHRKRMKEAFVYGKRN